LCFDNCKSYPPNIRNAIRYAANSVNGIESPTPLELLKQVVTEIDQGLLGTDPMRAIMLRIFFTGELLQQPKVQIGRLTLANSANNRESAELIVCEFEKYLSTDGCFPAD
jgi:hypothetical protein